MFVGWKLMVYFFVINLWKEIRVKQIRLVQRAVEQLAVDLLTHTPCICTSG